MHDPQSIADAAGPAGAAVLERLRARGPRVHCVTNTVAQNFTANVLLALGCVPSMTLSPEEIGGFVARSDALLVNLGTFDRERREAITVAVETARNNNVPWVLDPVFIDRSATRAAFAKELMGSRPKVVRLNHAEFSALAGEAPSREAVSAYARAMGVAVGLSGETDLVADDARGAAIANGHPLMTKVTAMGCAGSAIIAACLAVEDDAWCATVAGLLILNVAGECAAHEAAGPGSFAVAILDALYRLDGATLIQQARVS